jgi:histidinol-phosphate aminotransferase
MSQFLKPSLSGFEPYAPGVQPPDGEQWVKLNTNESPFAPSPRVIEAITRAATELQLYPDSQQVRLRHTISQLHDLAPEQVICGNGADEALAMALRAFVGRTSFAAYMQPSYSLVPALLRIHDVRGEEHSWAPGYRLPATTNDSHAGLKFVVNPNSPTGTLLPLEEIDLLCRRSSGMVLLDEAYVDFAPVNGIELLARHHNLLIVRTLSKSYGLAGLRLGYALGARDVIEDLFRVKDIYNVDRLALAGAEAAVQDQEYKRRAVASIVQNRERLSVELRQRGFEVLPSAANFVFAIPNRPAYDVLQHLQQHRVLVRHFNSPGVVNGLRISVGTWEQCQSLLLALDS